MNTWTVLVGVFVGLTLVMAPFFWLLQRQREHRKALKERPPQQAKLLRPPGYSLLLQLQVLDEKLNNTILFACGGAAVFGITLVGLTPLAKALVLREIPLSDALTLPHAAIWMSAGSLMVAGLAFSAGQLFRIRWQLVEIRNKRFGLRGEQAVAEALNSPAVIAAGYVAFHDVPGDGSWNIDHVVVGPGGAFVLETKARARRKATRDQPEHVVIHDGKSLIFPWCEDRKVVRQAARNAEWVREFIADFAPDDVKVQPLVVVPGWYVQTEGNYPVKVMNAKYLAETFLPSTKPVLSPEQRRPILRRLEDRCRDVEF